MHTASSTLAGSFHLVSLNNGNALLKGWIFPSWWIPSDTGTCLLYILVMFLPYTKMTDSTLANPDINSSFLYVLLAYINYTHYWVSLDIFIRVHDIWIIFTPFSWLLQLSLTPFLFSMATLLLLQILWFFFPWPNDFYYSCLREQGEGLSTGVWAPYLPVVIPLETRALLPPPYPTPRPSNHELPIALQRGMGSSESLPSILVCTCPPPSPGIC